MQEGEVNGLLFWLQASSSESAASLSINLLSVTDKESVIVSAAIPALASDKQEEIKALARLPCLLSLDAALICWMTEIGRDIVGENENDDCVSEWDSQ